MENQYPDSLGAPQTVRRVRSTDSVQGRQAPGTPTPSHTPDPTDLTEEPPLPIFQTPSEASVYYKQYWEQRARTAFEEKEKELLIAREEAQQERARANRATQGTPRPREKRLADPFVHSSFDPTRYRHPKFPVPSRFDGRKKSTILVTNWLFEARRWCSGNSYDPSLWVQVSSAYLTDLAQNWYRGRTNLHDYGVPWDVFGEAMHKIMYNKGLK